MIYVPDLENYECFVIRDSDVIRAYKEVPIHNKEIEYRDYFYNSHYVYQDGTQAFSSYSNLPKCLDSSKLTNFYAYRNDFADILIIFFLLVCFVFFMILRLWRALFKGGRVI